MMFTARRAQGARGDRRMQAYQELVDEADGDVQAVLRDIFNQDLKKARTNRQGLPVMGRVECDS